MKYLEKILDVPKLILRIWLILWFILFILLGFKFCFNIWYPIVVDNEKFIAICSFIDTTTILKYSIMFLFYIISANFWVLTFNARLKYKNKWHLIISNLIIIICFGTKFINNTLGLILEIVLLLGFCILINIQLKPFKIKLLNILLPILAYLILNLWQLNVGLIRGILEHLNEMPTLIAYVLQLDYYVFILITWIGAYFMGLFSLGWLWGKSESELKTLRRQELNKKCPDNVLIAKIDKRLEKIAKREKR